RAVSGEDGVENLAGPENARADTGTEILDRARLEDLEDTVERLLGVFVALLPEQVLQHRPAELGVLGMLLLARETTDAGARLAGDDDALPFQGGLRGLRGDDLDLIAVAQHLAQLDHAAIDLGADAGVADLAVDGIGEV